MLSPGLAVRHLESCDYWTINAHETPEARKGPRRDRGQYDGAPYEACEPSQGQEAAFPQGECQDREVEGFVARHVLFLIVSTVCTLALLASALTSLESAPWSRHHFPHGSGCHVSESWVGWSSIKYIFVLYVAESHQRGKTTNDSSGDSYSATGFDVSGTPPSPDEPLGNPPYPGHTTSGGPNWASYLTVQNNASFLQTYDLAVAGAKSSNALHPPATPAIPSFLDQVQSLYLPNYAFTPEGEEEGRPDWTGSDALFAIWMGINDIRRSLSLSTEAQTVLFQRILAVWAGQFETLYSTGARNFLVLNVPPMHRTPDALDTFSPAERKHWARSITAYNRGIADILEDFKSLHPSTNIWLVDAWHVFNRILDNPTVCNVTSGIKEVRGWCPAYAAGRPEDEADCAFRVEEYFWWDSYHPSFVVHEALAGVVAKSLRAGPNVC